MSKYLLLAACISLSLRGVPCNAEVEEHVPMKMDWSYYTDVWLPDLPRATPDERRLPHYDEQKAAAFIDRYAVEWTERNGCGTCHTNVPALMARPLIRSVPGDEPTEKIRTKLLEYSYKGRDKPDAYSLAFMIPGVSAMAINDAQSGKPLDPRVAALLDYQYANQSANGAWSYPDHEAFVPFLERDRSYIATLAALAAGFVPQYFASHPASATGLEKLKAHLRDNMPKNLHGQIVLLWASVRLDGLLTREQQQGIESKLLALQNSDGGWTLPSFGSWPRYDGEPNDPHGTSDGYATGLATLVLCERGRNNSDQAIQKSLSWIESNQRESGRWYTRSLYAKDFRNYLSNMGTSYNVMAIYRCRKNGPAAS